MSLLSSTQCADVIQVVYVHAQMSYCIYQVYTAIVTIPMSLKRHCEIFIHQVSNRRNWSQVDQRKS